MKAYHSIKWGVEGCLPHHKGTGYPPLQCHPASKYIKSANIFINDGVYKLGDLNVSKVQDHNNRLAYTQTGTPYYASPEVWRDEPYDNKSDIWSLGCVLYEMCTFRPPFKGKDLRNTLSKCSSGLLLAITYSVFPRIGTADWRLFETKPQTTAFL